MDAWRREDKDRFTIFPTVLAPNILITLFCTLIIFRAASPLPPNGDSVRHIGRKISIINHFSGVEVDLLHQLAKFVEMTIPLKIIVHLKVGKWRVFRECAVANIRVNSWTNLGFAILSVNLKKLKKCLLFL